MGGEHNIPIKKKHTYEVHNPATTFLFSSSSLNNFSGLKCWQNICSLFSTKLWHLLWELNHASHRGHLRRNVEFKCESKKPWFYCDSLTSNSQTTIPQLSPGCHICPADVLSRFPVHQADKSSIQPLSWRWPS